MIDCEKLKEEIKKEAHTMGYGVTVINIERLYEIIDKLKEGDE